VPHVFAATFALGAALAGLAGALAVPIYQVSPLMGSDILLVVFAIIVVGGMFWPLIAVRRQEISTPALGILLFRDDEAGQFFGPLMAGAVIVVPPLLVAFLIAQRRFIDGLAITTMK
jgi:branched-subunit amino acid ABC-type transport system permease component